MTTKQGMIKIVIMPNLQHLIIRRSKMEWISVKDRWPEYVQGNKVWAFGGGYQFEAEYDDGFWTNLGGEEMTHWRPLPPNPKLK